MAQVLEHDVGVQAIAAGLSVEKMPAHWLMARLGKRVLRPGGRETTAWMLDTLGLDARARVVELAPGLGLTASEILARGPGRYVGVEREPAAVEACRARIAGLGHAAAQIVHGDASRIPLPDASVNVVVGEAMLSMQVPARKQLILSEAARVLEPGGRYAIHELAVTPDHLPHARLERIQKDLADAIHVGVRIGTVEQWRAWMEEAGFEVESVQVAPMRLLELDRILRDEGWVGTMRFVTNVLRSPAAARRLRAVRRSFRTHEAQLRAVAIVARRRDPGVDR